jgi:hypothetical protein
MAKCSPNCKKFLQKQEIEYHIRKWTRNFASELSNFSVHFVSYIHQKFVS